MFKVHWSGLVLSARGRKNGVCIVMAVLLFFSILLVEAARAEEGTQSLSQKEVDYIDQVKQTLSGKTWEVIARGSPYGLPDDASSSLDCVEEFLITSEVIDIICAGKETLQRKWDIELRSSVDLYLLILNESGSIERSFLLRFRKDNDTFMMIEIKGGLLEEQEYMVFQQKSQSSPQ